MRYRLSRDPAKLDARMLDLPVLEFKDRGGDRTREVRPQGGAWNVRDTKLMEGASSTAGSDGLAEGLTLSVLVSMLVMPLGRDVESWAIFSFTRRMSRGTVESFAEKMASSYKEKTGNYMVSAQAAAKCQAAVH